MPGIGGERDDEAKSEEDVLPWKLVIHYSEFPFESLFPVDTEGKVLLDAFINSVKEVRPPFLLSYCTQHIPFTTKVSSQF